MEPLTYVELVSANLLVSQCCMCDVAVGYKDAGRELQIGDHVVSHTYCGACYSELMNENIVEDSREFVDADY